MAGVRAMTMAVAVAVAAGGIALAGVAAQAPGKTVWDGAYSAEQARSGEAYRATAPHAMGNRWPASMWPRR